MRHLSWISLTAGTNMLIAKKVIEYKFNFISKIWKIIATILMFTGFLVMAYSFDA